MARDPYDAGTARRRAERRRAAARARGRRRGLGLLVLIAAAAIGVAIGSGGGHSSRSLARTAPAASGGAATAGGATGVATAGGTTGVATAGGTTGAASTNPSSEAAQIAAVRRLAAFGLPLYCGGTARRMVALTFDDGPGPYTSLALRKLRVHRVPSTFFIVGRNVGRFSSTLLPAESTFGAVGDHTYTHPYLPALAATAVADELGRTQHLIEQTTGRATVLFRPPYGGRTPAIDAEAKRLGMLEVIWSVDSRDSEGADYAQIAANVDSGMRPGAIVLMHENRGQTIRAMLQIFPALARKHLQPVTLPELLTADPPTLAQLRAGGRGCGGVSVSRAAG